MLVKPKDVFDREEEWADLSDFASSDLPGLRIAVLHGRRRQGKSYLLRRLTDATGGLYHLATEQTEAISLRRFSSSLAAWLGAPSSGLTFDDWEAALTATVSLMTERKAKRSAQPPVLVLDEFPYLVQETPGLPSIVQGLYDQLGPGSTGSKASFRIVLCGSAISVMSKLLSGTKALRGRAALEARINPFGYRESRAYWKIENLKTAFTHHALVGGTPGYRDLVPDPTVPESPARLGGWVTRNVLRPTVPLFDEANRVVHEDSRIRDTAIYGSLMAAIAAGESSPAKIAGLLGRPTSSLSYQLGMLESAGFVERHHDLLMDRRPVITVSDPIVRFHHLVIEPNLAELEAGRAGPVWAESGHSIDAKVLGPHFEAIARQWVRRHAAEEAGLEIGPVGQATIACREHRTSHEIDILGLGRGARPRTAGAPIAFIGEAKWRARPPGRTEIDRLEHIRSLLTGAGHDASNAALGLFSQAPVREQVAADVRRRGGTVVLAGLDHLYGRTDPT